MMMPQMMELSQAGMARPVMDSIIAEKDAPQTAAWMPNQPMQARARMALMTYLPPFSPREPPAMTAVGRPVSQPCMPMKHI